MLSQLSSMDLPIENRLLMETIIDIVSQLPERVGTGNRVNITQEENYSEHLRLADNTGWSTSGAELHLQLVKRIDANMTFHDYPKLSFPEIVEYVSSKNLAIDKQEEKSSQK